MRLRLDFGGGNGPELDFSVASHNNPRRDLGFFLMRGGNGRPRRTLMLTTVTNALAMVRFGGFRVAHGGGRDGFALLLIGLAAIGGAIWAVTRAGGSQPAKS
jgi:hypothetical protein